MKRILLLVFVPFMICQGAESTWETHEETTVEHKETPPVPLRHLPPWVMPKEMDDPDDRLANTVNTLFAAGMADPRGLPYHHVSVREGDQFVDARGWVFPPSDGSQRYAIGWTGLIYPVAKIGEPANLKADLETLRNKGRLTEEPFDNYQEESLDDVIAKFRGDARMMHPFAAPYLMLRLGYPITLHDNSNVDPFAEKAPGPHQWHLPYYTHEALADFAHITRDDGVAGWVDGDFDLAAERLRMFDILWQNADILWQKAKELLPEQGEKVEPGEIQDPFANAFIETTDGKHLPAPSELPQLNSAWLDVLADARRRLSPRPVIDDSIIEQAIASWDQIDEWSDQNPPASFRLVVACGPLAIKPLLDCLEHDQRWTRMIIKEDRNQWGPRVMRVRDLAILALNEVLQFSYESAPSNDYDITESGWYDEAASKYRTLCERYDYQWGPELWYRILKDPEADLGYQLDAVNRMVTPKLELSNPYYHMSLRHDAYCDATETNKEADILRDRKDPSVHDLMKQVWQRERERVDQKLKNGAQATYFPVFCGATSRTIHDDAHHIVHCMIDWNAWDSENLDVLRAHYQWLRQGLENEWGKEGGMNYFLMNMCEETLVWRHWAKDDTAIADYNELFRASIAHDNLPIGFLTIAAPTPQFDKIIKETFLGEKAPLSFVHQSWEKYDSRKSIISYNSPILELPSFRKALIEALQCKEIQATLTVTPEKAVLLYHSSEDNEPEDLYSGEGLKTDRTTTSEIEVRVCDLIAYHLTPGVGFHTWESTWKDDAEWVTPDFHLDGPIEQRDKAIAKWIELLKDYH